MMHNKNRFLKKLKKYCSEDPSLIEGYDEFLADDSGQVFDCHHKRELNEDGTFAHTKAELISLGLYYGRPASELLLLPHSAHTRIHRGKGASPETSAKRSEANKKRWVDPETRAKQSEAKKQMWSGPEYRAKQTEVRNSPAYRAKMSEAVKQTWSDPERRAKQSKAMKRPKSDFGKKFQEHYGTTLSDNPKLYNHEKAYYLRHGRKCSWE